MKATELKRIFLSTTLSFIVIATSIFTSFPVIGSENVDITSDETLEAEAPTPFWSVDFNNGFDDLGLEGEDYQIINSFVGPRIVTESINDNEVQVLEIGPTAEEALEPSYVYPSIIKIKNPFSSLGEEYFKEYEEYEDVELVKYAGKKQPKWTKGATISYWIKTPSEYNDETIGINSSIMTWRLEDYQYQADDYAKYLTCHKYDIELAQLKKEYSDAVYNESHVPEDSDYYFSWKRDEAGNVIYHTDEDGHTGPVYGTYAEKSKFGRFFWFNPNYEQGFVITDNGENVWMTYEPPYYEDYSVLPTIDEENGTYELNDSMVRFGKTTGSMQIDANSSIYWTNDDATSENLNINNPSDIKGMQHANMFNLTSWQTWNVTALETETAYAPSPYTSPNKWHMVTMTLMNDWVEIYLDGECVDVASNYSSFGNVGLDSGESMKRFNKGTGFRNCYGIDVPISNISNGKYVSRLFMDWLTNPDTTFTIGGAYIKDRSHNTEATKQKLASYTREGVQLAKIDFYSSVLTDEQIANLYTSDPLYVEKEEPTATPEPTEAINPTTSPEPELVGYILGDVNKNDKVEAEDALAILKHVVKLEMFTDEVTIRIADIKNDGIIDAEDALNTLKVVVRIHEPKHFYFVKE